MKTLSKLAKTTKKRENEGIRELIHLQILSIDVLYRTSKISRTGYRHCKIKVYSSPGERLRAPIRANSHKGSIVQTTKRLELKTIPVNRNSIHVLFNSMTVLYATQRSEGCSPRGAANRPTL